MPFRNLYVSGILASTGTFIYGSVVGNATGLEYSSEFKLQGQVTATSFTYAGTGTEATFTTSLTRGAISSQPSITTASSSLSMLVLDESTSTTSLTKISRSNFLSDVSFTGMITAYPISTPPSGWLLCNGNSYTTSTYSSLYSLIGYSYGGSGSTFSVPNMSRSTTSTVGFINYIIKT
jgi:microcystin-dependent protein